VFLTAGVLALVLLGAAPIETESGADTSNLTDHIILFLGLAVNLVAVGVTFAKGKLGTGVIGLVVPVVAMVGAIRLARPNSPWAHRRYQPGSRKAEAAESRDIRFDSRWRSLLYRVQDKVAGTFSSD
jgi:lysyl-tRNA synthetase class 2